MTENKHLKVFFLLVATIGLGSAIFALPSEIVLIGLGALIFALFVLFLVLRRLTWAFAIWFLIVPFCTKQPGLKNALDLGSANMTVERLLFIFLIMVFFVNMSLRKTRVVPIGHLEKTMIVFCSIVLISLWVQGDFQRRDLGIAAAKFLVPMSAFFLAKNLFKSEREITTLMWLLFGFGGYLAVTAFFEFFHMESFIFPRYIANPELGIHVSRARGPFLQAANNGTAIGMLFFTSIYLCTRLRSSRLRLLIISFAGLMLLGVFFSLTRGAWVGTGIGLLLVATLHRSLRRFLAPALIIGALSVPVILPILESSKPEGVVAERAADIDNIYYRINTWLAGMEMFWEHPIFGVGFGRYAELNDRYQNDTVVSLSGLELAGGDAAHNTYIEIAAELGLLGLIPYTAILVWCFMASRGLYRSLPASADRERNFIIAFWGAALTYLISSSFYTQNCLFLSSLFFALAGIIDRRSVLLTIKSRTRFEQVRSLKQSIRPISTRVHAITQPRSY